jgi:hypothetical protein
VERRDVEGQGRGCTSLRPNLPGHSRLKFARPRRKYSIDPDLDDAGRLPSRTSDWLFDPTGSCQRKVEMSGFSPDRIVHFPGSSPRGLGRHMVLGFAFVGGFVLRIQVLDKGAGADSARGSATSGFHLSWRSSESVGAETTFPTTFVGFLGLSRPVPRPVGRRACRNLALDMAG